MLVWLSGEVQSRSLLHAIFEIFLFRGITPRFLCASAWSGCRLSRPSSFREIGYCNECHLTPNLFPSQSEVLSRVGTMRAPAPLCEYRSVGFLWLLSHW